MNQEAFQNGFIGECIASNVDALMLKNAAERMSRDMKKEAALGGLLRLGGQAVRRYAPKILPWAAGVGAIPILRDIPNANRRYRRALGIEPPAPSAAPPSGHGRRDTGISGFDVIRDAWRNRDKYWNTPVKSPFLGPNAPAMKPWQF